jgi:nucleoid-associated protein YgaU
MVTPAEGPEPLPADHQVRRGDNLWDIAAGQLAAHPDHTLTVREYWLLVIDANRDRLRSGDPDLIFPGETIMLPPLGEPS